MSTEKNKEIDHPNDHGSFSISSAKAVVLQNKFRKSENSEKLLFERKNSTRCDDAGGEKKLVALFSNLASCAQQEINLSFLLKFPNIQSMFCDAFLQWGASTSPISRRVLAINLRSGFFRYLNEYRSNLLSPDEIDDLLLNDFRHKLMEIKAANGQHLRARTVASYLGAVRVCLGSIKHGEWLSAASRIAALVPNPPRNSSLKSTPVNALTSEALKKIIEVSEKEILETQARFENATELIKEADNRNFFEKLKPGKRQGYGKYVNLSVCLSELSVTYPAVLPSFSSIAAANPPLSRSIKALHGYGKIRSMLYASARDLVPFVLLLTVATVFNPETVLRLNWSDFDLNGDRAGSPTIQIRGEKKRASVDPVRLLDPSLLVSPAINLTGLLAILKRITSRLRGALPDSQSDRVFVFVTENCEGYARAFDSEGMKKIVPATEEIWAHRLGQFILENRLEAFTLSQIRLSIIDLVQENHGTLEAARKVGNHRHASTTWKSYTSSITKKKYRERIGKIMLLRERWWLSNGVIDPRRLNLAQDKGAATPGFFCLDPFDSPRPGQSKGVLCRDYGGCPSCPLAAASIHDAESVSYYLALERSIYSAKQFMSATTWLSRWAPVLLDLKSLTSLIPSNIRLEAEKLHINLPNVG